MAIPFAHVSVVDLSVLDRAAAGGEDTESEERGKAERSGHIYSPKAASI